MSYDKDELLRNLWQSVELIPSTITNPERQLFLNLSERNGATRDKVEPDGSGTAVRPIRDGREMLLSA